MIIAYVAHFVYYKTLGTVLTACKNLNPMYELPVIGIKTVY